MTEQRRNGVNPQQVFANNFDIRATSVEGQTSSGQSRIDPALQITFHTLDGKRLPVYLILQNDGNAKALRNAIASTTDQALRIAKEERRKRLAGDQ